MIITTMMMVNGVVDNDYNDNTNNKKVQTFICKNTCRHTNTGRPTLHSDFQVSWRIWLAGSLLEDTKLSIGSAAGQPKPNQPTSQPTKAKIHVYLPRWPKSWLWDFWRQFLWKYKSAQMRRVRMRIFHSWPILNGGLQQRLTLAVNLWILLSNASGGRSDDEQTCSAQATHQGSTENVKHTSCFNSLAKKSISCFS